MNKKAQLGKIIESFPTFLIISFIMVLFIFIVVVMSFLNKTEAEAPLSVNVDNPLLFTIQLEYQNGKKEITLIDAIIEETSMRKKFEELTNEAKQSNEPSVLERIANEKKDLAIKVSQMRNGIKSRIENSFHDEKKTCFIVLHSGEKVDPAAANNEDFFFVSENGKTEEKWDYSALEILQNNHKLIKISLQINSKVYNAEEQIFIQYYFGEC